MSIWRAAYLLLHVAAVSALAPAQGSPPKPFSTIDISPLMPAGTAIYRSGSIAFLSDHTAAVGLCTNAGCNLATFDLVNGKPRQIGRMNESSSYLWLRRSSDGGVILNQRNAEEKWGVLLLSPDLKTSGWIPGNITGVSQTGSTIAVANWPARHWELYRTNQPTERILNGSGELLDFSDDAVALLDQDAVRIEDMKGGILGSFQAGVSANAIPGTKLLGLNRLWFQSGGHPEIRDFSGKTFLKLNKEDGWGFRMGQSTDGTRLLYDRYTRHVGLAQSLKEDALGLATMGMSADSQRSNGELVRVIDTTSGKQCFEWDSKTDLLVEGGYHADIDPSGKLVAILTQTNLSVYKLPEVCTAE